MKFIPFSLKTAGAALAAALLFSNAQAAGLGKLTVLSGLGQPLHAEIELTAVSKDEVGALLPKLASTEAFRQANIDFNPVLFALRFAVEQRGGRQFIRVTSSQPINEPFVDMLIELGGAGNHLVREYTFLLDPTDLRSSQSPQMAPPILVPPAPLARRGQDAPAPESTPIAPAPSVQQIAPERQRAAPSKPAASEPGAPKSSALPTEYTVKPGDSLSKIAGRIKPDSVSLDQMLVALFRANPDAFVGKNMNRLSAGQILTVPEADAVSNVGKGEAHGIVVAQAADFNSYRDKLASRVATAAPQKAAEAKQSATGKITSKVDEQPTAANQSKDKLKLSKAGAVATADKAGAAAEERIAKDKAIAEANSRVKDLEKNVSDLQKLLELKNKNLADQQKELDAAKAALKAGTPAASAVAKAPEVKPAEVKPAEPKPAEVKPAEPKAAEVKPAETKPPVPTPAPAEKVAAASAPAASASAPAPKPKVKLPPPPPPKEVSLVDELLDSPFLLPGLGLLLAVFGAFGIYRIRARRNEQKKNFGDSIITDSSLKANSLFGSTGGQSVDTNNSVFNSNFSPSSHQLDTNEVDPVAEADVYIAYGRDAQAEEILKEALRTQPNRNAVRIKLLEIYSNRKDLRAFETMATELYGITKGEGEDWIQAANLGIVLDPKNPLYAAGKPPADGDLKQDELTAPTLPLEEPDLDALLAVTQGEAPAEAPKKPEAKTPFTDIAQAEEVRLPEEKPAAAQAQKAATLSNSLDFDLHGISLDQIEVPNTITRPEVPEPKLDLEEINFDFLAEAKTKAETVEVKVAPAPVSAPEPVLAALDVGLSPKASEMPAPAPATPSPKEFDLSGITLELDPQDAKVEPILGADLAPVDSHEYSNSAEMATKLDLAVAYQEIGDKEGARELLDEVVKGGTPEQVERAKSILAKLS